ncbi:putative [ribosomal protein S18]-alanine N-acetyltransferase [Dioscorea cayenensis subsp. rotundata]|uniref:[ribosomal protein S18]-alanine N-acetyltransferase n=1 Tax=Dioscorea cayennensis subsp. rotundata TaxID=55577 RepID=A0AB40CDB7_DIOCR|nr:putative [ribosomal protein S18]-alanine N-acetyltransferase [Dioscorea cayenensis subsp. rotundata]
MAAAKAIRELDPRRCSEIIDEIVRLEKKLFPKHESLARNFHDELQKTNTGLLYMKFSEEDDGEIVGYVMYSWISSLCASITKLAVKENYRRQGYGEALLKAAIQKCRTRRIQRVCLHVDPTRTPAVSLYQKLGFQIDELVKSYYSSDRNAFRMYVDFTDDS